MKQTPQDKLVLRRKAHQLIENAMNLMEQAGGKRHKDDCLELIENNLGYIMELQNQVEENHAVSR